MQQMTYRRLLLFLQELDDIQLNCSLTLLNTDDEFFPAILSINTTDDVLDAGHPYFCIPKTQRSDQHASQ